MSLEYNTGDNRNVRRLPCAYVESLVKNRWRKLKLLRRILLLELVDRLLRETFGESALPIPMNRSNRKPRGEPSENGDRRHIDEPRIRSVQMNRSSPWSSAGRSPISIPPPFHFFTSSPERTFSRRRPILSFEFFTVFRKREILLPAGENLQPVVIVFERGD